MEDLRCKYPFMLVRDSSRRSLAWHRLWMFNQCSVTTGSSSIGRKNRWAWYACAKQKFAAPVSAAASGTKAAIISCHSRVVEVAAPVWSHEMVSPVKPISRQLDFGE
ncbi:Uncharacterized protein Fot_20941 [Forsythia ovata]|uniref:Uncharacterized protein n=1 Tax=Forsythia ovata TaxID=205694 RepID=A0ABD1UTF4_9LAMI